MRVITCKPPFHPPDNHAVIHINDQEMSGHIEYWGYTVVPKRKGSSCHQLAPAKGRASTIVKADNMPTPDKHITILNYSFFQKVCN